MHISLHRKPLPLVTRLPPLVPRRSRALCSTPRSDATLPMPSLALQQACALFLRRLPLAPEDAAHRLRAYAKLVGENGRGEGIGVVRVQRAQAIHCCARKLVRGRPPLGKLFFHGGTVL